MGKYDVKLSSKYKHQRRNLKKRGYDLAQLDDVVEKLADGKPLPPKHLDHALVGNWQGFRECHIAPDWLLIYKIIDKTLVLMLQRTGTHSDLF